MEYLTGFSNTLEIFLHERVQIWWWKYIINVFINYLFMILEVYYDNW